MAKNVLLEAFALLGLNDGDKVNIEGYPWSPCTVTADGLIDCVGDRMGISAMDMFTGRATWHKLPWKPKRGDVYFVVIGTVDDPMVYSANYTGCISDIQYIAFGNCFRTSEEAEANKDALIAKLKEATE